MSFTPAGKPMTSLGSGSRARRGHSLRYGVIALMLLFCLTSGFACKKSTEHTSDPKLKGIDTLLNAELPAGTPMTRVTYFLNTRGYELQAARGSHTVVAVVRHVNTETLQPEAARVTFHFDARDRLLEYDLEPAPAQLMQ
jgi:hypothetical protein